MWDGEHDEKRLDYESMEIKGEKCKANGISI